MRPATCAVRLLGGFQVTVDGSAVPGSAWAHRRGADLVKLLGLAAGCSAHREQVMAALWPDLDQESARTNLRKAVHFARRALGTESAVGVDADMVTLFPGADVTVDVTTFTAVAGHARHSARAADFDAAARLYTGELLPEDRYELWAVERREHLRLRYLEMLKGAGRWEQVLEVEPTEEAAHRALMQAALDRGDRAAAIRQFGRLRTRLRVDLGVGPDRASVALYEQALAQSVDEPVTPAQRARALVAWGLVHLNSGDLADAQRCAVQARELAIAAGLGREVGEASALLGLVAHMQDRWAELFRSEFVDAVRREPQHALFVFDAHLCLAEFSLCGPNGHEEVGKYAADLLAVAEQAGSVQGRALATLVLGEVGLYSDRLDEAERLLTGAADLHQQAGASGGHALAVQRLAEVAMARGQRWKAGRLLRRARRLADASELEPHLLVRVLGSQVELAPDVASAVKAVREGDEALSGREVCAPCSVGLRLAAATAFGRAGSFALARQRLAEAERLAGMWQGGPWLGAVWEARAMLRRAAGEEVQATAFLTEAAELFASVGRPRDERRCRALIH